MSQIDYTPKQLDQAEAWVAYELDNNRDNFLANMLYFSGEQIETLANSKAEARHQEAN